MYDVIIPAISNFERELDFKAVIASKTEYKRIIQKKNSNNKELTKFKK